MLSKRLTKEQTDLVNDAEISPYFKIKSINDKLWEVILLGPEDTPYQGGKFVVKIDIPERYPFYPPNVQFETKIFHPNISSKGKNLYGYIKTWWVESLTTYQKMLISLVSLLSEPNPDNPLSAEAGSLISK